MSSTKHSPTFTLIRLFLYFVLGVVGLIFFVPEIQLQHKLILLVMVAIVFLLHRKDGSLDRKYELRLGSLFVVPILASALIYILGTVLPINFLNVLLWIIFILLLPLYAVYQTIGLNYVEKDTSAKILLGISIFLGYVLLSFFGIMIASVLTPV